MLVLYLGIMLWKIGILLLKLEAAPISNTFPEWSIYSTQNSEDPGSYLFQYEIEEKKSNNIQFRSEKRFLNGTVKGSYGYLDLNGNIQMVRYIADGKGYRATIENSLKTETVDSLINNNQISEEFSLLLLNALKSLKYYKKYDLEEQHIRPFDKQSEIQKINVKNNVLLNEKESKSDNLNQLLLDNLDNNEDFDILFSI